MSNEEMKSSDLMSDELIENVIDKVFQSNPAASSLDEEGLSAMKSDVLSSVKELQPDIQGFMNDFFKNFDAQQGLDNESLQSFMMSFVDKFTNKMQPMFARVAQQYSDSE